MADDTDNDGCVLCGHEIQEDNCKCNCELRPLRDEVFRFERELRVTLMKLGKGLPDGALIQILDKLCDARVALEQREGALESRACGK